ncbi:MAG: sulfite exporter TauE/SafE family protein, partial [Burkholderiales bacterium]|nr:sulfite exporter TauE/SafE family protein [Burkholderiales bacterium]
LFDRLLPVQLALYVVANALLVLLGLYLAGLGTAVLRLEAAGGAVWRFAQARGLRIAPAQTALGAVGVGMAWGWIPCGLVYSALALALVSGGAAEGALVMLAFGTGTLPTLLAGGLAAERLKRWARDRRVRLLAGLAVLAMGVVGFMRAPGLLERVREGILCVT